MHCITAFLRNLRLSHWIMAFPRNLCQTHQVRFQIRFLAAFVGGTTRLMETIWDYAMVANVASIKLAMTRQYVTLDL